MVIRSQMMMPRLQEMQELLSEEAREEQSADLFEQYTDSILVPALVALKSTIASEQAAASQHGTENTGPPAPAQRRKTALHRKGRSDTVGNNSGVDLVTTEKLWEKEVLHELERFRYSEHLPDAADFLKAPGPLAWWKLHHEKFPVLARLARLVFVVPASQIESAPLEVRCGMGLGSLVEGAGVDVGVDVGVVAAAGVAAKVSTSGGVGRLSSEVLALCEATCR
eukprot:jgi/Tetstr1/439425/TSEL_027859.t1